MTSTQELPTVKNSLLQVSYDILSEEREVNAIQTATGSVIWNAHPDLYPIKGLGIRAEILGSLATNFTITEVDMMLDDGESSLLIVKNKPYTLNGDEYAIEFLEIFKNAFQEHSHTKCKAMMVKKTVNEEPAGTRLSWLK